jgi:hypothetical protein
MAKQHGGTHHIQGTLHRGITKPEATDAPYHAGSGAPKVLHAPPGPGSTVNRGGTFSMGSLKKRK